MSEQKTTGIDWKSPDGLMAQIENLCATEYDPIFNDIAELAAKAREALATRPAPQVGNDLMGLTDDEWHELVLKAYSEWMGRGIEPIETIRAALPAAPQVGEAAKHSAGWGMTMRRQVEEAIEWSEGGMWLPCSGCLEIGEYGSVLAGGHSDIFGMTVGMGCSECGGIGATWHEEDPHAAYTTEACKEMLRETGVPITPQEEPSQVGEECQKCHGDGMIDGHGTICDCEDGADNRALSTRGGVDVERLMDRMEWKQDESGDPCVVLTQDDLRDLLTALQSEQGENINTEKG